ncbi:hypothetical protein E6P09_03235 [Haloferax mediterranei ATCC 33500]|uniref:Uncharacterized protein n=1 Tax=Haloferax mediterranei (strain ATCC 33500 / DSM 1411 / JCM 8866 / NBRC 14739 / NCIMB 2177 / R-4) TaxID=523841 RepID=A0A4V1F3B3_HALMT|nr:hypothetical protein [Haloferax mediterranei]MDX5987861.1 hypothetical protein [Haloferax mediterranei ATCC 33500]QCQ74337.1 hypothetical protein E6P09_03235 [Haloferax mediterranei ATCC 33500]
MTSTSERSSLDSPGGRSTPALPVCDAVPSSVVGEHARVDSADDSVCRLFSSRHSTRVGANVTAN